MKAKDTRNLAARKESLDDRLDLSWQPYTKSAVLGGGNLRYEVSGRVSGVSCGGMGLIHEWSRAYGLPEAINRHVHVFKVHKPYHESDHVLNLTYNFLAGGRCIEDLERLRQSEPYLDLLRCHRIPDPTTAGDFLRRFEDEEQVQGLMDAIDEVRVRVWKKLPRKAKRLGVVDLDGTLAPTSGECKEGMDISYKGVWGYHPLVVSFANTQEVLYTRNRPGNVVSHEGAAGVVDRVTGLLRRAGFRRVRFRGDTDFSLTEHFDRWTEDEREFVFGMDAHRAFVARAREIPEKAWRRLSRRKRAHRGKVGTKATPSRLRPANVKEGIVFEREYENVVLEREDITEIEYRPGKAKRSYRMIVLRKTIAVAKGQLRLRDEIRYFFYVTNVPKSELSTTEVVFEAHARCNQENVIEQLKHGVPAMRMPSDRLLSNWVYLVIGTLAWNITKWIAVTMRGFREAKEIARMEFPTFLNSLIRIPCQVVQHARGLVLRILRYSPWARFLADATENLRRMRLAST